MNVFQRWLLRLARVSAVEVGRDDDGLVAVGRSGTDLDRPWSELLQEFTDARSAWHANPLARRLISLVTSHVVGDGIQLAADDGPSAGGPALSAFLAAFWSHPENRMEQRQHEWCDELGRAGELFISLHMNPADGMSYVRALPASSIDRVDVDSEDYERETQYHEVGRSEDLEWSAGKWWTAYDASEEVWASDTGRYKPVVLHFAVNRAVGCVRGESDLSSILTWMRRYTYWLEDRVRLNAAVHAFLWVVKVPSNLVDAKKELLRMPPTPGNVMVADRDNEDWQAVAPSLHANDAGADGRALRWMIAAGGPGTALIDLGEADDANLATAKAMGEMRSRVLRNRQAYFGYVLASVALAAYNRAVKAGLVEGELQNLSAVRVIAPDISPADNAELGESANQLANALATVAGQGIGGDTWRRLALRMVLKFAGEALPDAEVARVMAESAGIRN